MKLPQIKTKNLWIGNIFYFENGIGRVSESRYLVIKSKNSDKYTVVSDDISLPDNLTVKLGFYSKYDNNGAYLINSYSMSEKTLKGKLSFDEVKAIAEDVEIADKMPFWKQKNWEMI